MPGWDRFSPFGVVGDLVGQAAADGWSGIMLALWSAGLWVLRLALDTMDRFLTPDISAGGPAAAAYRTTFWAAGAVVLVMVLTQLGVAAFRRDGTGLARVLIGAAQFAVVWAGWISYGIAVLAACGGLSRALMRTMLGVSSWSQWHPMPGHDFGRNGIEAGLATVLGILGLFLWVAAIGHFLVMLTRAAALLILTAVTPIAAAGLVSETGRAWMWKSLRWFHAAALTPVLTVLVLGLGVKLTTGVAQGGTQGPAAAIGTAFPGVMLILVSVVAPVALFRLLAFVDPGTSSGAAMRTGVAAAGGLQGLLGGTGGQHGGDTGGAATRSTGSGQSEGEAQRNAATANRVGAAMGAIGGPAAGLYSTGLGLLTQTGAAAAAVGTDTLNQTGVGDTSYFPDHARGRRRSNPDQPGRAGDSADGAGPPDPGAADDGAPPGAGRPDGPTGGTGAAPTQPPPPPTPPRPPTPPAPAAGPTTGATDGKGTPSGPGPAGGTGTAGAASGAGPAAAGGALPPP
jgi:hypothetical protein